MKKIITMLMMMATGLALAGVNDTVFSFSTKGVDRYADGTAVAEGECYALVWAAQGCEFAGFLADGSLADADNNRVVLVAPVAHKGRCPKTVVQINEDFMSELADGSFAVVLLDTRMHGADGSVRLAEIGEEGMPEVISAMSVMEAKVELDGGFASAKVNDAAMAGTKANAPADAPVPEVTSFQVKNGIAAITFTNVVPYAQYNVQGGVTLDKIDGDLFSYDFNGEPDADGEMTVCFTVEQMAGCGYFRIVRR